MDLAWEELDAPALRKFANKCPARQTCFCVCDGPFPSPPVFPQACISVSIPCTSSVVARTWVVFPVPHSRKSLPQVLGTALQGCSHGENDPIRAGTGARLSHPVPIRPTFPHDLAAGCNYPRHYSPCFQSAVAWNRLRMYSIRCEPCDDHYNHSRRDREEIDVILALLLGWACSISSRRWTAG